MTGADNNVTARRRRHQRQNDQVAATQGTRRAGRHA